MRIRPLTRQRRSGSSMRSPFRVRSRGVAAIRLRGMSASRPRRRRDSSRAVRSEIVIGRSSARAACAHRSGRSPELDVSASCSRAPPACRCTRMPERTPRANVTSAQPARAVHPRWPPTWITTTDRSSGPPVQIARSDHPRGQPAWSVSSNRANGPSALTPSRGPSARTVGEGRPRGPFARTAQATHLREHWATNARAGCACKPFA